MDDPAAPSGSNDLGDFLRARRAALDLRRAGLPDDGRLRRVPGLRREELSRLANVSVDYIVRLEQGRTRRVSRPVLEALADALQLSPDDRAYLETLAEVARATRRRASAKPDVADPLRQLLEDMRDIPAMIVYRRMHVLAWNVGAAALLTDFGAFPRKTATSSDSCSSTRGSGPYTRTGPKPRATASRSYAWKRGYIPMTQT